MIFRHKKMLKTAVALSAITLVSCTKSDSSSTSNTVTSTSSGGSTSGRSISSSQDLPAGPSSYFLDYPVNALSNISSPVLKFQNLNPGDQIRVYTDDSCSSDSKIGEGIAVESEMELRVESFRGENL